MTSRARILSSADIILAAASALVFVLTPMRPSLIQSFDDCFCSGAKGLLLDAGIYVDGLGKVTGPAWTSGIMYILTAQVLADVLMAVSVVAVLFRRTRSWARLVGGGAAATLLFGEKPLWFDYRSTIHLCDVMRFMPLAVALVIAAALIDRERRRRYGNILVRSFGALLLVLLVLPNCSDSQYLAMVPWGTYVLVLALSLPLVVGGWGEQAQVGTDTP